MIVPAVLTAATVGILYATRKPVNELKQNQRYRMGVVVGDPAALAADPRRAAAGTNEALVKATLEQIGFTNVKYVKTEMVPAKGTLPGNTTYWFDATWSLPQTTIPTLPVNWISGVSLYPKYLGIV